MGLSSISWHLPFSSSVRMGSLVVVMAPLASESVVVGVVVSEVSGNHALVIPRVLGSSLSAARH